MNIVSLTAAILGMVLGTAGFVMSIMNYLRDRPRVKLTLVWDMTETRTKELCGMIKVTNIGRRPIFISAVALEVPSEGPRKLLVSMENIQGKKLSEGDMPITHIVSYSQLCPYSPFWKKMRAYAEDSTGKRYYSKFPAADAKAPQWVDMSINSTEAQ